MKLGPLLNKNKTNANFSAENSLGIEGVAASMQDAVCPVINTVTPRAFYWAFLVWIYYDFYTKIGIKEKNYKNFVKYLRRQDFYFIAATILSENDTTNLVGIRNVTNYLAKGADPVLFNDKYYSVDYGGMNNYVAGCISRDLICTKDGDEVFSFPKLNSVSKELGESFERAIKLYGLNFEYYKNLANCYTALGKAKQKIVEYKDNSNPLNKVMLGLLYINTGNKRAGMIALDSFCMSEPELIITGGIREYLRELSKE